MTSCPGSNIQLAHLVLCIPSSHTYQGICPETAELRLETLHDRAIVVLYKHNDLITKTKTIFLQHSSASTKSAYFGILLSYNI